MTDHLTFARQAFGLQDATPLAPPHALPLPEPGQIVAITGATGAGKTRALEALVLAHGGIVPATFARDGRPMLAHLAQHADSARVLRCLASTGLADARLWQTPVCNISAGERARLALADALLRVPPGGLLVLDEFDSHLDELTACAIAQAIQRLTRRMGLRVVVSTHRPQLLPWLAPARVLELSDCLSELVPPTSRRLADELEIVPGRLADWRRFWHWHYLGQRNPGPVAQVWIARLRGREVGIATFGFPHLMLAARTRALPPRFHPRVVRHKGARALNREVRLLQRVVVDPRVRGAGIASALLRYGLQRAGVRWVECIAQLGCFSGFLTGAGFVPVADVEPSPAAKRLMALLASMGLQAGQLGTHAARAALLATLPQADALQLSRALARFGRCRVQTGHGSARTLSQIPAGLLDCAIARLYARPVYYLWDAEQTDARQ